jgi:hypothetical protein
MTGLVTSERQLSQVVAPRLPNAPLVYEARYLDQLNNILRLYFNQLDKIVGQLRVESPYTVATLPSAVTSGLGARAFVSDALTPAFGATVVGGGAVAVPVYSDGTNWKVG